jgi:hypothetical protein
MKANPENRCQYSSPKGRPCRMQRSATHPTLCHHHARQEERTAASDFKPADPTLALDLLGPVHDFRSAASINHVLGKLLVLLTTDRIPPRNAAVTAYICQLLLQSLGEVKNELYEVDNGQLHQSPELLKAVKQILKAPQFSLTPSESAKGQISKQVAKFETDDSMLAGVSHATS